jgi:hypothetical protein
MKTVSRREFVATAAAVGAGAMLRVPAFGASSAATSKAVNHEVVAPQARSVPDEGCKTSAGSIKRCGRS